MSVEGVRQLGAKIIIGGWLLCTGLMLAIPANVSAWSDDYPPSWQGPMDSMFDSWGYYNRECTSFTAWRLHSRNGFEMPRAIGNAGGWGNWATAHGYLVNMTPAVGSVAWFSTHVAWVESVGSGFVTIEDYNGVDSNHNGVYGDDGTYSERNISTNSVRGYIHFRDGSGQGGSGVAGLSFFGSDHLSPNQELGAGQYMLSDDARFFGVMQNDGNFVVYGPGNQPYWSTHTAGSGAVHAIMQTDGNFVLYRSNWTPAWNSHTDGLGTSALYMQSDGNLVVYKTSGPATWASNSGGHSAWSFYSSPTLDSNQSMILNRYVRSIDKRYVVALQDDGNLVLYSPGYHVLWHSSTGGRGVATAIMQSDGNLVLYSSSWQPIWDSHTGGAGPSTLYMQSDGNLVIYNQNGGATWSTNTGGML